MAFELLESRWLLAGDPAELARLLPLSTSADTQPPTIIATTPTLNGGAVTAGTASLEIRFSEAVVGGEVAANFRLQSLGPDDLLGTADDIIIPITVGYGGDAATLRFAALPESVYRLTARDAITDLAGNPLDGNGSGEAGGDWQCDFAVVPPDAGTFPPNLDYFSGYVSPQAVLSVDVNADGILDLVTANVGSGDLTLSLGTGTGEFAMAGTFSAGGSSPRSLAAGDFNGDGTTDLAVAHIDGVGLLLGNGRGGFLAALNFGSGGSWPYGVAAGDFNGDGRPDLAVANNGSNDLGILLNTGSGFAAAVTYAAGGSFPRPYAIAVGDFNGDGNADLAVANSSANNVGVRLGTGTGEFGQLRTFASGGTAPRAITIGDFNGDGKDDLVVANSSSANVGVLIGDGLGWFAAAKTFASGGTSPTGVAGGDFDADGKADLAVVTSGSGQVGVLRGDGTGNFQPVVSYASGGTAPESLTVGDFNADGRPDLAVANTGSSSIGVLLGASDGGFAAAADHARGGASPRSVATADFNGDGTTDLAVANAGSHSISVLLGTGRGGFATAVTYASGGASPVSVATGDFNGDGRADLAVTHSGSHDVAVLLGNGAGGFAPAVMLASGGYNPTSVAVGDFNGDGRADVAVVNANSNQVGVLLGDGAGGFAAATVYATGGTVPRSVSVGDFNGDGASDLAVAHNSSQSIGVLLGDGAGGFAPAVTYASGGLSCYDVTSGDLNADGILDLAVVNYNSANVGVLLGIGNGEFSAVVTYPSGDGRPTSLAVGDFDGDGWLDLAATYEQDQTVGLLRGDGTGRLSPAVTYAAGGLLPMGLGVGDFNADGRLDVAVVSYGSHRVAVLLGAAAGGLNAVAGFTSGGDDPRWVATGDFDGDGNLDVVAARAYGVGVLLGEGGGRFATALSTSSGGSDPMSLTVGDFNNDGRADVAVAHFASNNVGILLGLGTGRFATAVLHSSGGVSPRGIASGDFNADGHLDLAVTNAARHNVGVLLGDGMGGFAPAVTYASGGGSPYAVAVGDFNADGSPDLAVANYSGGNVGVLLGDGAGGFAAAVSVASGGLSPRALSVGDFNGDGKDDLAVANAGSHSVGILLGDGTGGFAPAVAVATGGLSPQAVTISDFNADGWVDLAVANSSSRNVAVLLGNGEGWFTAAPYASGRVQPYALAAGDFDADGNADLVVARFDSRKVGILLNVSAQLPGVWELDSPQGFGFGVQTRGAGAGQLVRAGANAVNAAGRLEVAGQSYAAPLDAGLLDDAGRTVVTPAVWVAGLYTHREITVPDVGGQDFARTVDVFHNPGPAPISTTVRIVSNLGTDAATTVFATSDGDGEIEVTDRWIGTDGGDGSGAPAVIHFVHGPAGLLPDSINRGGDNLQWAYTLTVPGGQTVRLAHFTIVASSRAAAEAAADVLVTPGGFGGQAAAFLTQQEVDSLANFGIDVPPTVASIVRQEPAQQTTSAESVVYRVTFSEHVNDVSVADFTLVDLGGTLVGAAIASVSAATGIAIDVVVNTGTEGEGELRLDVLVPPATIVDEGGYALSADYTAGQTYLIDRTAPRVVSILRASDSPSMASEVQFTVEFSEPVTGVDPADFALSKTGSLTGESIVSVTGSGAAYTVAVNTGEGDGTLGLNLVDDDSIADLAGNALIGSGGPDGSFVGPSYEFIRTGAVRGLTWKDINGNGLYDPGEPGLPGVTVYVDLNRNGILDPGEPSAVSADDDIGTPDVDERGTYEIRGVPWGDREVAAIAPEQHAVTYPTIHEPGSGALSFAEVLRDGQAGVSGLLNPYTLAVSPDGRHVYAAGYQDNALTAFRRDPISGHLSLIQLLDRDAGGPDGVGKVIHVAVSPDGQYVYALGVARHALSVFRRDELTGGLSHLQTLYHGEGGIGGLLTPRRLAVSPDGQHVYVTGNSSLSVFSRDPTNGSLSQLQILYGLWGPGGVAVSPDGQHVYVAASTGDSITLYSRDAASGLLSMLQVIKDGEGGVDGLDGATSLALSPDGRQLYVGATSEDHSLAVFQRDATTGHLAFAQVFKDGVDGMDGLRIAFSVAVSGDGRQVFVTGADDNALTAFTRDEITGLLTAVRQMFWDGQGGVDGLEYASGLAVSADGRHLYVAGYHDSALAVFSRDAGALGAGPHRVTVAAGQTVGAVDFGNRPPAPVVASIVRADANPTTAATVDFHVLFSAPVTGVDAADFSVQAVGVNGAFVSAVSGSGASYTVTVATGGGDGSLLLAVEDDDTILDAAGNPLGGPGLGNGRYEGSLAYFLDRTPPVVSSIVRLDPDPTSASLVSYLVTFSEDVVGIDHRAFLATAEGLSGVVVNAHITGVNNQCTVYLFPGNGSGTLRLDVLDQDTIGDEFGNPLGGPGPLNGSFTAGEVYQVQRSGIIRGAKWHDANANGIRDAGEPGLPGWTIFLDSNANGRWDPGERSTITDENGEYVFEDVPAGTHLIAEVMQPDWESTWPPPRGLITRIAEVESAVYNYDNLTAVSGDGRYIAFSSWVPLLVEGDTGPFEDIFVLDRQTGAVQRVSVSSSGDQANERSHNPTLSADGRYVAFRSAASNLVDGDTNAQHDIFVHDRQTGQTRRVSISDEGAESNGFSSEPVFSADGRFLAFYSAANNLVPGDTNAARDTFLYDLVTGTIQRVSIRTDGGQASWESGGGILSSDGSLVVFDSLAPDLVAGDTNSARDVFLRDRQTGTTRRISVAASGTQANNTSRRPWISGDGRYVVLESYASNLVPGDTNGVRDIFLLDLVSGHIQRVSVAADGTQADGESAYPQISGDGRFVVFESAATNLVQQPTGGVRNIYRYDRLRGTIELVTAGLGGAAANGASYRPQISGDGLHVTFQSAASNLVPGDSNNRSDAFVADFLGDAVPPGHVAYVTPGDTVGSLTFGSRYLKTASVVGRHIFYNGSFFDGNDPAANAEDDGAISVDKVALRPGQTATFANYTSYARGINGIMVDLADLAVPSAVTAAQFEFRVGNSDSPADWLYGPVPTSVAVRAGAGVGGSNRVTLIWPDGAMAQQWLEITVKADALTGLGEPDRFYFGHARGESGNSTTNSFVDGSDFAGARDNPRGLSNPAPVDFRFDYNRDSFVDGTDLAIARDNHTTFLTALRLISVPGAVPGSQPAQAGAEGETVEPLMVSAYDFSLRHWLASPPAAAEPSSPPVPAPGGALPAPQPAMESAERPARHDAVPLPAAERTGERPVRLDHRDHRDRRAAVGETHLVEPLEAILEVIARGQPDLFDTLGVVTGVSQASSDGSRAG